MAYATQVLMACDPEERGNTSGLDMSVLALGDATKQFEIRFVRGKERFASPGSSFYADGFYNFYFLDDDDEYVQEMQASPRAHTRDVAARVHRVRCHCIAVKSTLTPPFSLRLASVNSSPQVMHHSLYGIRVNTAHKDYGKHRTVREFAEFAGRDQLCPTAETLPPPGDEVAILSATVGAQVEKIFAQSQRIDELEELQQGQREEIGAQSKRLDDQHEKNDELESKLAEKNDELERKLAAQQDAFDDLRDLFATLSPPAHHVQAKAVPPSPTVGFGFQHTVNGTVRFELHFHPRAQEACSGYIVQITLSVGSVTDRRCAWVLSCRMTRTRGVLPMQLLSEASATSMDLQFSQMLHSHPH